jgi:hypothetical protein
LMAPPTYAGVLRTPSMDTPRCARVGESAVVDRRRGVKDDDTRRPA